MQLQKGQRMPTERQVPHEIRDIQSIRDHARRQ